jgi:phosphate transport system protein
VTVPLRRAYYSRLARLESDVIELGLAVGQAMRTAVTALDQGDLVDAARVNANDRVINARRWDIERQVQWLIATQQPTASDLRRLVAALQVAVDLERIGDYAAGIARNCLAIGRAPRVDCVRTIRLLAEGAVAMLDGAIAALEQHDAAAAQRVALEDDRVDAMYRQLSGDLLDGMSANRELVDECTQLLFAAHHLERVADRAQNVCERIAYANTGHGRLQRHGAA